MHKTFFPVASRFHSLRRTCVTGLALVGLGWCALTTSQAVFPTMAHAVDKEAAAAQAKQLQIEGTKLQLQRDIAGAISKYRESLALKPDEKLADLVTRLEQQYDIPPSSQPDQPPQTALSEPAPSPAQQQSSSITESLPPVTVSVPAPVMMSSTQFSNDTFGQYRLTEKLFGSLRGGVIKGSETDVYINLGQIHGVGNGGRFEIVRLGEPIEVGGEIIGHEESRVAVVEAVTVREKLSICKVLEHESVPQTGDTVYQQKKKIQRMVVGQFSYNQGLNQLTKNLQEKLVTAIAAKGIQVVERDKLEQVLREQQLGYSGLINIDSAKKIGELLGAEGIILGTVSDLGNEISLNGRMVDIGTGNTLSAGEVNLPKTPLISQLLEAQVDDGGGVATPKTASAGPAKKGKNLGVQEKEGFEFTINDCKKSGGSVTCDYTIVSQLEDRDIYCYSHNNNGTGLWDNFGNSYSGSKIQLANCNERSSCRMVLISGIPTRAAVTFDNVTTEATYAPKISLGFHAANKSNSVEFRDIKFSTP